jgi:dipeptidyl aminopeptidase/acylaminoacyl peptidase
MRLPLFCLLLTGCWNLTCAAQELTPERAVKFLRISELHYAPDGSTAVFEASAFSQTHLWLADPSRHQIRQLTFSEKSERSAAWSASGDRLAFLSNRAGPMQVYVMPRSGGEARALTANPSGVTDFQWSPDGKQIAYLARKPQPAGDTNAPHVADRVEDLERLWVADVESGAAHEVMTPVVQFESIAWASAGHILAVASEQPALETFHSAICDISTGDGTLRWIAKPAQPLRGLWLSPDRKHLAFTSTQHSGPVPHDLFVQPTDGGAARDLTASIDRFVQEVHWQNDATVVVRVADGFVNRLVRVNLKGPADRVDLPSSVRGFDVARNGDIMFVGIGFNRLPEVFIRRRDGSVAQIGELQNGWDGIALVDARIFRFPSFDGTPIEAALLRPHAAAPPLVLLVHGGPASNFSADYFWFNAWAQLLVARGYAVLLVNPRGSLGYGEKFVAANRGDLGGGDFKDLLAALDVVIARGDIDARRVGIGGWSYGAQMTEWAIGHSDRFRAAVAGGGVFDEASEYLTEDSPAGDEWYFGTPWEHPDVYARNSPVTFIGNARTPTLIVHGEDDPTNPVAQSKALYRALKRVGVQTQLITYPGEPHLPRQEPHQVDIMKRMLDWFDRYLK